MGVAKVGVRERTAECYEDLQSSASRTGGLVVIHPSSELLGYFHSARIRGRENIVRFSLGVGMVTRFTSW